MPVCSIDPTGNSIAPASSGCLFGITEDTESWRRLHAAMAANGAACPHLRVGSGPAGMAQMRRRMTDGAASILIQSHPVEPRAVDLLRTIKTDTQLRRAAVFILADRASDAEVAAYYDAGCNAVVVIPEDEDLRRLTYDALGQFLSILHLADGRSD